MSRKGKNIYQRKDGRWEGRYIKGRIDGKIQYCISFRIYKKPFGYLPSFPTRNIIYEVMMQWCAIGIIDSSPINIVVSIKISTWGNGMEYLTSTEMSEKWDISRRRVSLLCKEGRIEGAVCKGRTWLIPADAKKPDDARRTQKDSKAGA